MTKTGRPVTVKTHRSEEWTRRRSREYATRVVRLQQMGALGSPGPLREADDPHWKQVWITAYARHWRMSHGQSPHVGPSHGVKAERGQ